MAKLSPYLFRYAPPKMVSFGSKWKKFANVDDTGKTPVFDDNRYSCGI